MGLSSSSSSSSVPLLLILLLLTTLATKSASQPFKCTTSSTCRSLIDFVSPNATTISAVKDLFSIKNLRTILGANNLPPSTSPHLSIAAQQTIKIPFACICINGTGVSNKRPTYKVVTGDGLDHIAREVFSGLMTYQQIAKINGIPDPNMIRVGQELWIPLPCSCEDVGGEKVVHYGHIVESGSTLELIAQEYGTTRSTVMSLNGIANDSSLLAGQVLDVPLRACNSWVSSTSADYPLLVPNGTYVFTANSCVKCKCNAANNWTLECEPSGLPPAANSSWSTCPSMLCDQTTLSLSNTTTTSGCNTSTCSYSGFSNQTIMTTLSTCPASDNYGTTISLSWKYMLIALHLVMLIVYPL
ncbi:lysM domain-containing GPI-anchored protein 2 isoform X1 [Euphorbia lathyris]|uniref:lysM domain-containing GPI-anchored protein 2 isoform X1 n=1 Tax=Euphorbia lathyris TaxID=212925 RepID=UPI0033138784